MRKTLILLTPLLLAGCIDQSGSYYVGDERDHAITVHAAKDYVWADKVTLDVVVSHMPDCQRAIALGTQAQPDVAVELFSNGDGVYTLRAGTSVVQVDTNTCTRLADPAPDSLGDGVGVFSLGSGNKMEFNLAAPAAPAH